MDSNAYRYREEWLTAAMNELRTVFRNEGATIPSNIRVTCGFPSARALRNAKGSYRNGECWDVQQSKDRHFEIMISPIMDDTLEVIATLAHELVHATVGLDCGHKGEFAKLAKSIGLLPPMKSTTPGDEFKSAVEYILEDLGPYPHASLDACVASSAPKKQGTRMLKVACPECDYTVRMTRKHLDDPGPPNCPRCEVQMVSEVKDEEEEG